MILKNKPINILTGNTKYNNSIDCICWKCKNQLYNLHVPYYEPNQVFTIFGWEVQRYCQFCDIVYKIKIYKN